MTTAPHGLGGWSALDTVRFSFSGTSTGWTCRFGLLEFLIDESELVLGDIREPLFGEPIVIRLDREGQVHFVERG